METVLKSIKWLLLLSGVLIVLLGITMLFTPLGNLVTLTVFIVISMLVSGVSEIASFFRKKNHRNGWMQVSGIATVLFAVWALLEQEAEVLVVLLPFIFAVWVMSSGVMRIAGSICIKSDDSDLWKWILTFNILSIVLGFLLLFSPILSEAIISFFIGVMLISYGLNNIIIFFRLKKISRLIQRRL
ncbi:MAG TPA: hypothetical protein GXZ22_00015 [Clostridiaceae bacterium]|nr:hypothetical protein [Clostridiaceae bacterium]